MIGSEKQDAVLSAFVALQVGLTNPTTDAKAKVKMKQGGEYGYSYLSLPALLDHIAGPRREAGLAIAQEVHGADGFVAITTYLIHLSGQWIAFGDAVFPAPNDPQQRGAVISYARRYSLLAALGLAAEDDDAVKASATSNPAARSQEVPSGRDGEAERGAGEVGDGEGPAEPAPQSTPSAQPEGHHEHEWKPSPNLAGWRYCTVKGCGRAERIPKEAA